MCTNIVTKNEIFALKERHANTDRVLPNKNFFSISFTVDVFQFVAVIISLLVTALVMYTLCKHMKLKTLVSSIALQQIKEVGAVTSQEDITPNIESTCKTQWYIALMLSL